MAETHAISALIAKRAELAGLMLDLDRQKSVLRNQLHHVDHTLAIMGYGDPPRAIPAKRPKLYRFKRRELPRLMADCQRQEPGLSNRDIAVRVIGLKGWDSADAGLVRKVAESVKKAKNWASRNTRLKGLA